MSTSEPLEDHMFERIVVYASYLETIIAAILMLLIASRSLTVWLIDRLHRRRNVPRMVPSPFQRERISEVARQVFHEQLLRAGWVEDRPGCYVMPVAVIRP